MKNNNQKPIVIDKDYYDALIQCRKSLMAALMLLGTVSDEAVEGGSEPQFTEEMNAISNHLERVHQIEKERWLAAFPLPTMSKWDHFVVTLLGKPVHDATGEVWAYHYKGAIYVMDMPREAE